MELNGRKVVNAQVDDVDPRDYPDFCDAYFSYAEYEDTGEPLSDSELDRLTFKYPERVNEMAYEHFI